MRQETQTKRDSRWLRVALGAPAVGWFFQLCASYAIAAYACAHDRVWILHGISVIALLLSGAGVAVAWKHRIAWRDRDTEAPAEQRFLAVGSLLLAGLFFLIIATGELSNWLLEPCL